MMDFGGEDQNSAVARLQRKIYVLEGAIKQIVATKKHLQKNAQEVKTEIHASVSRQLESLRNREVWLLSQVEVIQQAKEEILRKQEDTLNQALGGLQNYLECEREELENDSEFCLSKQLSASLDRLDDLTLTPEETPYLSYHVNPVHLREAIHSYGEIDAKHLPLHPFADPEMTSTSLPQAFEDYDDEEHHVLFKPVSQLPTNAAKVNKRVVTVSIPKMSERPQDWLFIPPETKLTPVPSSNDLKFPPFKTNLKEWMTRHTGVAMTTSSSSSSSIHQWLREIQSEADIEDGDFDVVSPTEKCFPSSPFEEVSAAVAQSEESIPSLVHFRRVLGDTFTNWLAGDERMRAACEFGADYPYEAMRYFREVNQDTKKWLMDYQKKQQTGSGCCRGACATDVPTNLDIENLTQIACVQSTPTFNYFKDISSKTTDWLVNKEISDKAADWLADRDICEKHADWLADVDDGTESSWTRISSDADRDVEEPITGVCRANEPCKTFSDCVCDENCCMQLMGKNSSPPVENQWLATSHTNANPAEFNYFRNISEEPSDWLVKNVTSGQTCSEGDLPKFSPFHVETNQSSEWLAPLRSNAAFTCPTFSVFKQNAPPCVDTPQSSAVPQQADTLFPGVDFQHGAGDNSRWLSSPASTGITPSPSCPTPDESNPWLLKKSSSPLKVPSDPPLMKVFSALSLTSDPVSWLMQPPTKESCQPTSKAEELPELAADNKLAEELFACFRKKTTESMNEWLISQKF